MEESWVQAGGEMGWHKWFAVWLEEATETSPIEKKQNKKSVDIIYYYDQQEMSEDESVLICLYIFLLVPFLIQFQIWTL